MPTYLYETLSASGADARRFEMRQHFDEPPLTADPLTGEPVRRVISGGIGIVTRGKGDADVPAPGCGPESCTCGRFD